MANRSSRPISPYAKEACELLGSLIQESRIQKGMTIAEMAERAGVSRGLVARVEAGDLGCSIGVVFEMAALLKIELFGLDPRNLSSHLAMKQDKIKLLPQRVRKAKEAVYDDF